MTPSPNASTQASTMSSNEARPWSSLVIAMIRGIATWAHSRQSATVVGSISSPAGTTNTAASAARSPARSSPTKSGWPGASRRLICTSLAGIDASVREAPRSGVSLSPRYPSTRARRRCSNRVVFPEPLAPTRTTLRTSSGDEMAIGELVFEAMA